MQPRERQVRHGLHRGGAQHSHAPRARRVRSRAHQPRLADPWLAAKHQRLTPRGYLVQKRRQESLFLEPTY
jgi:hypothetical protein